MTNQAKPLKPTAMASTRDVLYGIILSKGDQGIPLKELKAYAANLPDGNKYWPYIIGSMAIGAGDAKKCSVIGDRIFAER